MSKFIKKALGLTALVALFPYKTTTTPLGDEENAPKDVSVESLIYKIEVNHKTNEDGSISDQTDVNFTFHTEGISKVVEHIKKLPTILKEKSGDIKEKSEQLKVKADELKVKAEVVTEQVKDFVEDAAVQVQAKASQAKEIITSKIEEVKNKGSEKQSSEFQTETDPIVEEE